VREQRLPEDREKQTWLLVAEVLWMDGATVYNRTLVDLSWREANSFWLSYQRRREELTNKCV